MTRGITEATGADGTTHGTTAVSGDGTHGTIQDIGADGMDIHIIMQDGMAASVRIGDISVLRMVPDILAEAI